VHRAFSPKRHFFRREFKQRRRQLMLTRANGVNGIIPDILF
jgi:hypothetical protein